MRDQRGSVLMLLPAAVLVFLVLGALSVDFGGVYAAQRELNDAAEAAANDAASRALDLSTLYGSGAPVIDPVLAEQVARASVASKGLDRLDAEVESVEVDGATVTVRVKGRAQHLFAKAVPGGPAATDVRTSATAEARRAPG